MKKLKQLNIDYVRQNPLWEDLLDVIDTVNTEQVILPTQALEDIRNISRESDPNITDRSIRQLGFRLVSDILELNRDKLHKIFYHLSLHHEINGTPLYPKFLEFLLGRGFSVYSTYTADFINFFPEPKGDLVHEGGFWYKTSHVDLSVDQEGLVEFLNLEPKPEDLSYLSGAVAQFKGITPAQAEEEVRSFINDADWESHSEYPMYETFLLEKRILDLFYTYAPIEEVVRQVYFSVITQIDANFTGSSVIRDKEYVSIGSSPIKAIHLLTSTHVTANTDYSMQLQVVYENGAQDTLLPESVEFLPSGYGQYTEGQVRYNEPTFTETIQVIARKRDMVADITVYLYPVGVPMVPNKISVRGANSLRENSSTRYYVYGQYGTELRPLEDMDSVIWSVNRDSCKVENGVVTCGDLLEDDHLQVGAEYNIGENTFYTNKGVRLVNTNNIVRPKEISVLFDGLDSTDLVMTQGQTYSLVTKVLYTDNTVKTVLPEYKLKSNSATLTPEQTIKSEIVDRDYTSVLTVTYTDGEYELTRDYEIKFVYPRTKVGKFEILGPETIKEGTVIYLTARILWVLEEATDEQIEQEDPTVVLGWAQVQPNWSSYKSIESSIKTVEVYPDGRFEVPLVDKDTQVIVAANIQTESGVQTTNHVMTIIDELLEVVYIDLIVNPLLIENNTNAITCEAIWNDGRRTDIDADFTINYLPSQSTIDRQEQLVYETLPEGTDLDEYLAQNPIDYDSLITLELQDTDYTFIDKIKDSDTTVHRQGIYFLGNEGGLVQILANYTNVVTGLEHSQELKINLIPNINRAVKMEIEIVGDVVNDVMFVDEASRALVRAKVTYEDGSHSYQNPVWSLEPMLIDDEFPLVDITSAAFTGNQLISILSGSEVADLESFLALPDEIRNLPEFKDVPLSDPECIEYLNETYYNRSLIVTRYVEEDTLIQVKGIYYNLEDIAEFYIKNAPLNPIDTIVASRIEGPVTFKANYPVVSYAMYNTYYDSTASPDTWEYAVSSAWELTDVVIFEEDGITPIEGSTVIPFEIDQHGYLRPTENITAEATVVATFDDGLQVIVKSITVRMERANIELERLIVNGPATVYDSVSRNQAEGITIGYDDAGSRWWYIKYDCSLIRVSDPDNPEVLDFLSWSLENVNEEGITISDSDGKLYISKELPSDDELYIVAEYSEELIDGTVEVVKTRFKVTVESGKAIDDIVIEDPGTLPPDTQNQLEATYTRRSGIEYSTLSPEPGVDVSWEFVRASSQNPNITPEGITVSSTGQLYVPATETATFVTAKVTIKEGNTTLTDSFEFTVRGEGYPTSIAVVGYADVRDTSTLQYTATLERRDRPNEDATTNCLWSIRDDQDREVYLPNISIDNSTGIVTIGELSEDTEFYVYALYIENEYVLNHSIPVTARSSYPVQGAADAGINTIEELDQYITDKLNSSSGGSFILNAASSQYGYFAHRKDFGKAVMSPIDNGTGYVNREYGDWNGAQWPSNVDIGTEGPIELTRTYDNVTDTWYMYRTNNRGFQLAGFAFYYEQE